MGHSTLPAMGGDEWIEGPAPYHLIQRFLTVHVCRTIAMSQDEATLSREEIKPI